MNRFPAVVGGVLLLGLVAVGGGVYLFFAECSSEECINSTIGAVFVGLGLLAFLSIVPNMVGLVCLLSTLGFVLFLGLVFVFAKKPAGIIPPILLAVLAFAEQDLLRRYYAPRAPEHAEVS